MKNLMRYITGFGLIAIIYILMKYAPTNTIEPVCETIEDVFGYDCRDILRESGVVKKYSGGNRFDGPTIRSINLILKNSKNYLLDAKRLEAARNIYGLVEKSSRSAEVYNKAVEALEEIGDDMILASYKNEIVKIVSSMCDLF